MRTVSAFSLQPSAFPSQVQPVSKEALIGAIKKCHQTLWAGGKLSPTAAIGEPCKIILVKIIEELDRNFKNHNSDLACETLAASAKAEM